MRRGTLWHPILDLSWYLGFSFFFFSYHLHFLSLQLFLRGTKDINVQIDVFPEWIHQWNDHTEQCENIHSKGFFWPLPIFSSVCFKYRHKPSPVCSARFWTSHEGTKASVPHVLLCVCPLLSIITWMGIVPFIFIVTWYFWRLISPSLCYPLNHKWSLQDPPPFLDAF